MIPEPEERWLQLCRLAAVEQDPEKMLLLVQEINDLLESEHTQVEQRRRVGTRKADS